MYSSIGGQITTGGQNVAGALPIFLSEISNPSLTALDPSCKYLMFGMVKMFGLMGGTLAIIHCAYKNKREEVKGALVPGAITSFLVGITEPVEFTFVFAAPLLWVVYSVIDGLFQMFAYMAGCHVCAYTGIIDFCVYNLPLGIGKTKWPIFILLGVIEAVVCYFVFKFMIVKFNMKTLGREDDIDVAEETGAVNSVKSTAAVSGGSNAEKARTIINGLGGKDNILTVESCFTRLRVSVKDPSKIKDNVFKSTGSSGVVHDGNIVQIIYGVSVNKVRTMVDDALGNTEE